MPIANKIANLMDQGSWIRRMFEEGIYLKLKHGEDNVFDLSLGNPIVEPPAQFFDELRRFADAPESGAHRYMPNAGYGWVRAAVAAQLSEETGLPFTEDHVLMAVGAGGALNVALKTLLDPGDEVVVFAPYFVEYLFYADNHAGKCQVVPPDDRFLPDLDAFRAALGPRTRAVIINSPNNPTGVLYPSETLSALAAAIRDAERLHGTEIYLISDEPYRRILFDGLEYPHVFRHHPRAIVATSHSKDLALPGERIGYIAIHPQMPDAGRVMDGLVFCNRTLGFVNAPALMQRIVASLQDVTVDVADYQRKRDFLYDALTDIGYQVPRPDGAFYMFPRSPIADDVAFVAELQRHLLLAVPGAGFGHPGHFRISYCVNDAPLERAIPAFRAAYGI